MLDIGGQDTKAISLLPGGRVGKFEMNDRCSAGTVQEETLFVPDEPDMTGALGAALWGEALETD